jgi:hypothetical protein
MKKLYSIVAISIVPFFNFANAQIIINEVYGGGGNIGARYNVDFIELINSGTSTVTLTDAYIFYASSTGKFSLSFSTALPNITLYPGQTYLIQEGTARSIGVALPTPDIIGTLTLSGTKGKVALTKNNTVPTSATGINVIDFVGYGAANQYEGSGPTVAPSNKTAVSRTNAYDKDDNFLDFTVVTPTPQNSGSFLSTVNLNSTKGNLLKNTSVKDALQFAAKATIQIINSNGQVVKSAFVDNNSTLDISFLPKGMYLVKGTLDGEQFVQKIIKN